MQYYEVRIKTTIYAEEMISAMLNERGAQGVVIEDRDITGVSGDYIDSALISDDDNALIKAYFPTDNIKALIADLTQALGEIPTYGLEFDVGELKLSYSLVDEEDWANNWKKYYKPLKIGKKIVICPKWEECELTEDELMVKLDPGMAFGTGQHESTAMCVEALERKVSSADNLLDLGCGSGILGICAKKLGARNVTCVDIDVHAVDIARENAEYNDCDITFHAGNALISDELVESIGTGYDIVVANIIADVIIAFVPFVHSILKDGGAFISSGIIDTRAKDVMVALQQQGFKLITKNNLNGWVCIEVRK